MLKMTVAHMDIEGKVQDIKKYSKKGAKKKIKKFIRLKCVQICKHE